MRPTPRPSHSTFPSPRPFSPSSASPPPPAIPPPPRFLFCLKGLSNRGRIGIRFQQKTVLLQSKGLSDHATKESPNMKTTQQSKFCLGVAGEYAVCSELARRGLNIAMPPGGAKHVDVYAGSFEQPTQFVSIQIKATAGKKAVTRIFQAYRTARQRPRPDFWVVVQIGQDHPDRFFVFSHQEMGNAQKKLNHMTKCVDRSGGCDSILISRLAPFEDQWQKILDAARQAHRRSLKIRTIQKKQSKRP